MVTSVALSARAGELSPPAKEPRRLPLLQQYLDEQQRLTAVERFSRLHEDDALPAQAKYYRALLPAERPKAGQQYAFSVDLDRCTGCKGCVTACHNLNGLDDGETWRSVGLLHGGTPDRPLQQTVTTACHHCLEPGCLKGCPVNAYEKDADTGIVRHLDDQCIGCQYCTLTCPYEVPQYNKRLGIVRKCDLCSDRLQAGEAPACVQGCPNEAIAIRLVSSEQMIDDAQSDEFLPGAPSPGITLPSTEYKTKRAFPKNTVPADFFSVRPAHNHVPLVVLLVLTQLSVGAFSVEYFLRGLVDTTSMRAEHALASLFTGVLALLASVAHLGRPLYGYRAVLNLRHSWMSREILGFGLFSLVAFAYAGVTCLPWLTQRPWLAQWLGWRAWDPSFLEQLDAVLAPTLSAIGLATVGCSVMLYAVTGRSWWQPANAGTKFYGTSLALGLALTLVVVTAERSRGVYWSEETVAMLCRALSVSVGAKLLHELWIFTHLTHTQMTDLKRTALLLRGELLSLTQMRFGLGLLGGVVLPGLLGLSAATPSGASVAFAAFSLITLLLGELLERSLFFMAAAAPKMPGAVGS